MKDILDNTFWGNTIENWLFAVAFIVGSVILAKLMYALFGRIFKRAANRTATKLDDILIDMLEEPIVLAIVIIGLWWGYDYLTFEESVTFWIHRVFKVLIAINLTWLAARIVDALLKEYLIPYAERSESNVDHVMPIIRKSVRSLIWVIGIVLALNNAGYDVGALIAGIGIGGIALAMAAKDFVANIFGGITVFTDKPFAPGDRIKIGGYDGFVLEIGIRSTRLRTLEGRVVTVPNHKFTDSFVENVSAEPSRKVKLTLGLTYDTTQDGIQQGLDILKNLVLDHPQMEDDHFVWFEGFGDFSLNISLIYYIRKEGDLFDVPNQLHLSILEKFNAAGLEFAFPTQTVFHQSLDSDQGK
ncbi:MAG: mechanosensitive ion channel family protein [Flavobacteriales bacterium]|nr:mechanosensitive ion channel family protein [Flavobacteriales bacterium]